MQPRSAVDDIRDLVVPLVAALGCGCYDVEIAGAGRARTVRVLLDRDGGVDLEAITTASRTISAALDDSSAVKGPYLLEVSSPGLERPLRRPEHYRGALGEEITISYHTDTGPRRARGTLVDAGDEHCVLETDGGREEIAYAAVTKARTVFEWGPQPRPGSRKRGKSRVRAEEKAMTGERDA